MPRAQALQLLPKGVSAQPYGKDVEAGETLLWQDPGSDLAIRVEIVDGTVSRMYWGASGARLREQQRKALIPFITAGDPSLEATVPVMHALVEAGADVIELGVPFSDPMADGPTIQRSSERALARGAGSRYVLQAVAQFRERDAQTPVVLMGYLNPVEIHGYAAFADAAVKAGVDAGVRGRWPGAGPAGVADHQ
ncbi:hypothetical protein G6F40_013965 [Rhizopus arrhizus]|nr:hypothetical protein G6F40_013965 [Rhizopus arrhizus]